MREIGIIASFLALCAATAGAARQLPNPAVAFGHRPAVEYIGLSPSGNRVVYLGAGAGEETFAYVADIGAGTASVVMMTDGDPM